MPADALTVGLVIASGVLFVTAAALALGWAAAADQFAGFERAARSIFDADEPVGEPTPDRIARHPSPEPPDPTT